MSSSTFGGGHMFMSRDGGATFSDRSGNLPDIPVNALTGDPGNKRLILAATDHGVYRSKNASLKWSDFSNGLPNVVVGDIIFHSGRRRLRIGTRNRGIWGIPIDV